MKNGFWRPKNSKVLKNLASVFDLQKLFFILGRWIFGKLTDKSRNLCDKTFGPKSKILVRS